MDTAAVDALVGEWPQLEAPTEHTQGQREGTRGSQIIGMRQKGGEFEALEQLRTFVGCSATAQWAAVGEAPAPQLTDRPRSPPQRGNGRERLEPPTAHRHMRPLHVLEPGRLAEAGARVQASIVGLEPTFSTCSDARSSTTCCQRWAARRSALIAGRQKARGRERSVASRNCPMEEAGTMELDITCVFAPGRSDHLICGMAPKVAPIRRSWAADRQLQWRWCQAKRRNHISRRLAVRMRRVLAAVLAHSLEVGGRRR